MHESTWAFHPLILLVILLSLITMPCVVPFSNKSLDISFFTFSPLGVFSEELIDALKCFSFHAEDLGCAYSAVFKSIHGNRIIWYGAWMKRSNEERKTLSATLVSEFTKVSSLATLVHHGFFDVYVGESKDGFSAARFSSGDVVFLCAMLPISGDTSDLSYTCLALMRSCFEKVNGIRATVCLQCQDEPMVVTFQVWNCLSACYTWLLTSDYRKTIHPYISHHAEETKLDVFKVVYASKDDVPNIEFSPPQTIEEHKEE